MKLMPTLRAVALPLILLSALLLFYALYNVLGLPSSDELVRLSEVYLTRYGYLIVFLASFIEATLIVNVYFPGSAVVLLSVAFAQKGTLSVPGIVLTATLAIFIAYMACYALGRFGWYRLLIRFGLGPALERVRLKIVRHGLKWLWIGYVHPNLGSLAATGCGIISYPFGRFAVASLIPLLSWNVIWAALASWGSGGLLRLLDIKWLIPIVLGWFLVALVRAIVAKSEPELDSSVKKDDDIPATKGRENRSIE